VHPARRFIYYLLTHQEQAENEEIRSALGGLKLFEKLATDEVIDRFRKDIEFPVPYKAHTKTHLPSINLQKKLRVHDMHRKHKNCVNAIEILNNPLARDMVEPLLLAGTAFAKVAKTVNKKCNTRYLKEDIATFYHYFFEVEAIHRHQWTDAIKKRGISHTYKSALIGNTDLVLWRLGEKIAVRTQDALEEAFTQTCMRLLELRSQPTNIATMKMLQMGVESIVRIQQAMAESDVKVKEVIERLQQFKQSQQVIDIPSIEDLGESSFMHGLPSKEKIIDAKEIEA
jgi:hypothetical protein